MEIQSLYYFVSVYKNLSFSKAAKDCYVTQPVISRKIAALEAEFRCAFFRRTSQGVLPTEGGKRFLEYARQMLELYGEAARSLPQYAISGAETLSIAAVTPAAGSFLPETIAKFYAACPGVELVLDRFTPGEMRDLLPGGGYDFYITVAPDLDAREELCCRRLLRDGVSLMTRAEQAPADDAQAAELLRNNPVFVVARRDSPYFFELVLEVLAQLDVRRPELREVRPLELLSYCVSAKMGVALSPTVHDGLQSGLRLYEFRHGPQVELGIGWREATPQMELFLRLLSGTLDGPDA